MEKIFDIAKDSEKSWGVIAQGIDGNFEEVAEKINEVLSEIDGEYAYSFATGVGGIYNVSKDISLKNGETLTIKCASLHGFNAAPYIGLYKDDDTQIGENYENLSSAIRDIVTKYGLSNDVYLIDLAAYIPDGYKVDGYMLNGHLSPMGYMYMAFIMNTYIDWIIRNNGVKFRDTALIGTGYKPDYN